MELGSIVRPRAIVGVAIDDRERSADIKLATQAVVGALWLSAARCVVLYGVAPGFLTASGPTAFVVGAVSVAVMAPAIVAGLAGWLSMYRLRHRRHVWSAVVVALLAVVNTAAIATTLGGALS